MTLLGKIINIPDLYKESLPDFHLDGELWYVFDSKVIDMKNRT